MLRNTENKMSKLPANLQAEVQRRLDKHRAWESFSSDEQQAILRAEAVAREAARRPAWRAEYDQLAQPSADEVAAIDAAKAELDEKRAARGEARTAAIAAERDLRALRVLPPSDSAGGLQHDLDESRARLAYEAASSRFDGACRAVETAEDALVRIQSAAERRAAARANAALPRLLRAS
jgi:hypothetical protein